MQNTIVMSLGGSLIVPEEIATDFLTRFKQAIEEFINQDYRFIIFAGGGKTARKYQDAAQQITSLDNQQLDWLGIKATHINALLLKYILQEHTHDDIIYNPEEKVPTDKKIIVGAGWKPGWSTDFDTVLVAKQLGVSRVINMSNIEHVYDSDPRNNPDAKKFDTLSWDDYRNLIDGEWSAGLSTPFDPIASKEAHESNIQVDIIGPDIDNFKKCLKQESFIGTIIK